MNVVEVVVRSVRFYATVLLHKTLYVPKAVKVSLTLSGVCEYFRMNFNNSVRIQSP